MSAFFWKRRKRYFFTDFVRICLYIQKSKHIYIENNTRARVDMEFLFVCSTRYLTSERSERVKYKVEHEKRNYISSSNHVLFCLFYKHTKNDVFPKISDHFPFIYLFILHTRSCFDRAYLALRRSVDWLIDFRRFPKSLQKLSEGHTNVFEHFRKFPKIIEDFRW